MNSQAPSDRFVLLAALGPDEKERQEVISTIPAFATRKGAEVHLVSVVSDLPAEVVLSDIARHPKEFAKLETEKSALQGAAAMLGYNFGGTIRTHLVAGAPAKEILQLATDVAADCILVAPHAGSVAKKLLLGSVSEAVAKRACCTVIVARPKNYREAPIEIEPPCSDCLAIQASSAGATLFCERHSHHPRRLHQYHESPSQDFGRGSMFIR